MAREDMESEQLRDALRLKVAVMMSAENSNDVRPVEEWHLVDNTRHRRLHGSKEEPIVDTTQDMTLHSKRTERLQKKLERKGKNRLHSLIHSFLDLPSELLLEILIYLRPSDLFSLKRVSRPAKDYIEAHEIVLGDEIIKLRYPLLAKCFPLPVPLDNIDKSLHPALLSPKHQQRLVIHKAPYLHISPSDPKVLCSCMACVLAWNNLCLILDLAHWQGKLDEREPVGTFVS